MESNVTEILREAGPNVRAHIFEEVQSCRVNLLIFLFISQGLHVNEISAKCGLDSMKLGMSLILSI